MKLNIKKSVNCQLLTVNCKSGQALVTLLVFVSMASVIIAGAVAVAIINTQTTSKFEIGEEALAVAEAGADNAILKILRTPNYSNGSIPHESLIVGNGTAEIDISGPVGNITITSIGQVNNFIRKISVTGTYNNNQFILTSWQQID
ncbi:hypothetical protein A2164_03090 [Candidatus Curtissbacteria bacterium RBG_13_35_7]|uniref:Type 4 fimbrial biogenesis protein PilX N-terminal domain-containing protein n=1 Tax=Candidatus Curtissbacteria bacterium RBG_13_35_7 TaxID=1797705 RepID=A0A1F5G1C4_9BACT|nr:MAG: hypothetical protein A2164_03090 [Candidatus Curtissbacteria bacterium RBG_13_35_7]